MSFLTRTLRSVALVAAAAASTLPAFGHGNSKPAHGGKVEMSGETLLELVVAADGVALYLKDDDDDIPSSGLTAKLMVASKTGKTEVAMQPAAGNKFEARGVKVPGGSKVSVMLVDKSTQAKTSATFSID